MKTTAIIKSNKFFSKGWLAIALLISLFSFESGTSQVQSKQIKKIELVGFASVSAKRVHSFKSAFASYCSKEFSLHLAAGQLKLSILAHAVFFSTRFNEAANKTLTFQRPTQNFTSSHIPHSSDEDHFNSTRG